MTTFLQVCPYTFSLCGFGCETVPDIQKISYLFQLVTCLCCVCLVSEIEKALGLKLSDVPHVETDSIKRKVSQRAKNANLHRIEIILCRDFPTALVSHLCPCGFISSCQPVTMATSIMIRRPSATEVAMEYCDGPNV